MRNHHKPIRKLEYYFVQTSGMGLGTLTVRVTAWDGEVVQDVLPGILDSQVVNGLGQFSPLP